MRIPNSAITRASLLYKTTRRRHVLSSLGIHQRTDADGHDANKSNRRHYSVLSATQSARLHPPSFASATKRRNHLNQIQQQRNISWLPDLGISIWGGSGFLLKTLHSTGMPYWACFATISVGVRAALFPLVYYGAQTSARFSKVVPEIQFLLSLFQNDLKKLQQGKRPWTEKFVLMRTNLATLSGIYKLHKIHPLAIFASPLAQLPIFWYISVDLRKIVNGLDPLLAQALVDAPIAWIPDLTEPDPWFGLPVLAGLCLYANVEVAIGSRSLARGASKSDTAVWLKDAFQSFGVFMPCFTSQLPAGVQIYLVTSFLYTAVQSGALRTESFRASVGLPSLLAPPAEAKYATEFIQLKQLEQEAIQARGPNGPVLGQHAVLAGDWTVSFAGKYRPTTIKGSDQKTAREAAKLRAVTQKSQTAAAENTTFQVTPPEGPWVRGVSAPLWQLEEQQRAAAEEAKAAALAASPEREYVPQVSDQDMERANRGEPPTRIVAPPKVGRRASSSPVRRVPKKSRRKKR